MQQPLQSTTTPISSVSQTSGSFSSGSPLSCTSHSVSTTDSGTHPAPLLKHLSRLSDSGVASLDERPDTSGLQPVNEEEDDESGSKPTTCASPDSSYSMAQAGASHAYGEIHVYVKSVQQCTGYSVRQLRLRIWLRSAKSTQFLTINFRIALTGVPSRLFTFTSMRGCIHLFQL
ncbi:hypothetical protein D915_010911 [Fasciola hepatica]|uniref:Uncharacterized protein n=1 Tax=Fasciola hepatica TaxID=6192 RepID=A0A4E0R757_FASHE|nr:hypothetical protein D915_010911 [Fasciola hepatica]